MELGSFLKITLRMVDVTNLQAHLGHKLSKSLPGFHAFTGCDFTASFFTKGKVKPFSLLEKNEDIQEVFGSLGQTEVISPGTLKEIESFVCSMYKGNSLTTVNELRLDMFLKAYQTKYSRLTTIRGFDGSIFPPCVETLMQKIKRTNYVCNIWLNATLPDPPECSPIELGWKLEDGKYVLHWFDGNHLPATILSPDEDENIVDRNERYFSDFDSSGENDVAEGYFIH